VILVFLGEWRMTAIAVMTIPVAVLGAIAGLSAASQTINVMTLAGLALAIGPLVDSAIICLENTHRHLGLGAKPREAAFLGASEVAMPELVASLCNDEQVTAKTPPTFLFHTGADTAVPPENSTLFYLALRKHKVPAEIHIYEQGRHGVGLAAADPVLSSWPDRLAAWLKSRGLLKK